MNKSLATSVLKSLELSGVCVCVSVSFAGVGLGHGKPLVYFVLIFFHLPLPFRLEAHCPGLLPFLN